MADFWDPVKDDDNVKDDDSDSNDVDSDLDDSPTGPSKVIENRYHIPMVGKVLGYRRSGPLYFQCLGCSVWRWGRPLYMYRMLPGGIRWQLGTVKRLLNFISQSIMQPGPLCSPDKMVWLFTPQ